jgi:hypothetical protein
MTTTMSGTEPNDLMMVIEQALFVQKANQASSTIRKRLAAVAQELRAAAANSDTAGESLLRLASHFDEQATAGEDE